jgi:hypothetical protein
VFDWKKIVRDRLGNLALDASRHDEIVEELAQQLESAYSEELARGVGEAEAARRSLQQFRDWDNLRSHVSESVRGAKLPIWQQTGSTAPRRPLVWAALTAALAFLALPAFRKGLQTLLLSGSGGSEASEFSARALPAIENSGDTQKLARTLAYVALHDPDDREAAVAAEKAIVLDPQLTWISAKISHATYWRPGYDPKPWIERLKAWDPDNAFPYLLEADASFWSERETHWGKFNSVNGDLRRALAADPRWRVPMEKAFSASRVDSYADRQFLLDRDVLLEQHLDRGDKLLIAASSTAFPDLFIAQQYADHLLFDIGDREEKAGHNKEALAAYQNVASFGEKLEGGTMIFERVFSSKIRQRAYRKMLPLLRRERRNSEAHFLEATLAAAQKEQPNPIRFDEEGLRSATILVLSGLLVLLTVVTTAVWLLSIAILRAKPSLSTSINWLATRLGWAPAALPVACLGVFLSFFPYSRSIAEYSSAEEFFVTYGSLMQGVGLRTRFIYVTDLLIDHMFWPLIWCAAIALLGVLCLRSLAWRRQANRSGSP